MTMTAQEAAFFLGSEVAWEPGLRVEAAYDLSGPSRVHVTIYRESVDSSLVQPDGTYPPRDPRTEPVTMNALLTPGQYETRETALYHVIRLVTELHEHESREFTRVKDPYGPNGWGAPFHPHRPEGNALWQNGGRTAVTVYPDLGERLAAVRGKGVVREEP